jgi:hypothetical protein
MRFLVTVVGAGAALTLIAASGLMNWLFMTSLGRSEFEQQILGAVSVAVSALLALLPTLLVWAWRERRPVSIVLGVPLFLAFAAFSLSSAVGFAAKNRGSLSEDRALHTAQLAGVRQELQDNETKLKELGAYRPLAVAGEWLRGLEQDRRWQSSKSCTEAASDASRTFCKGYFEVKAEAARAGEAARLDTRITDLKKESRGLEAQGAGREADSQAAVLAGILGLQAAKVERGMMLFLAVLAEAGAALGLYFATGHVGRSGPVTVKPERGVVVEGEVLRQAFRGKLLPPANQTAGGQGPRRVPRLKQS